MYVANRVANRYNHSAEGRGVEIYGKEENLCIEKKSLYGGGGRRVVSGQLRKKKYSLTAYQPGNLCLGGRKPVM